MGRLALWRMIAVPALAAPASSCGEDVCTLELRFGIYVEVRDAATGGFLTSLPRGIARDGAYADSLLAPADPNNPEALVGVGERPGTYEVHIKAAGYAAWDSTGIEVEHDGCHVETAFFTARLTPVP